MIVTKEFIKLAPSPSPSPSRGEGNNTAPPLRGGDEGEGDVCCFTNNRISKRDKIIGNPKSFILVLSAGNIVFEMIYFGCELADLCLNYITHR